MRIIMHSKKFDYENTRSDAFEVNSRSARVTGN